MKDYPNNYDNETGEKIIGNDDSKGFANDNEINTFAQQNSYRTSGYDYSAGENSHKITSISEDKIEELISNSNKAFAKEFVELKKFSSYSAIKLDQLTASNKRIVRLNRFLAFLLVLLTLFFGLITYFGIIDSIGSSNDGYFSPDPKVDPDRGLLIYDTIDTDNLSPKRDSGKMPKIGADDMLKFKTDSPIADIAEFVSPSTVAIYTYENVEGVADPVIMGEGSGIVLSEEGYILTNYHVIEGDSSEVVFIDDVENRLKTTVVGYDKISDIAVIKVDRNDCIPANFGDSDALRAGETAISLGNSLGGGSGTVTSGIVSGLNRDVYQTNGHYQVFIQTDTPINPGNSGGPLVNSNGEVIGVNTLKSVIAAVEEDGFVISAEGVSYAIPINNALEAVKTLIKNGRVERPSIGINYLMLKDDEIKKYIPNYETNEKNVAFITGVSKNGPADKAGIKPGDVIVSIAEQKIVSQDVLRAAFAESNSGDKVELILWSGKKTKEYTSEITLKDMANIDYINIDTFVFE